MFSPKMQSELYSLFCYFVQKSAKKKEKKVLFKCPSICSLVSRILPGSGFLEFVSRLPSPSPSPLTGTPQNCKTLLNLWTETFLENTYFFKCKQEYNLRQKSKLATIQYCALENGQAKHFFSVHSRIKQAIVESLYTLWHISHCIQTFKRHR